MAFFVYFLWLFLGLSGAWVPGASSCGQLGVSAGRLGWALLSKAELAFAMGSTPSLSYSPSRFYLPVSFLPSSPSLPPFPQPLAPLSIRILFTHPTQQPPPCSKVSVGRALDAHGRRVDGPYQLHIGVVAEVGTIKRVLPTPLAIGDHHVLERDVHRVGDVPEDDPR